MAQSPDSYTDQHPDEITFQELWQTFWSRRLLIVGLGVLFSVAAAIVAFQLPLKFEASVLLAPVDDDAGGGKLGAGALLSQFGGLAALGGINIRGSGRKAESVATLQSAALTQAFIADEQLLPVLYEDKWDSAKQTWTVTDPEKVPTLWKAEKKFRKQIRTIDEEKKTGIITLTITWTDPEKAAAWANELVARANNYLRSRAIEQSKKNLDYLNEQLTKTSVVELHQAIYDLIEAEVKKVMVANGNEEYAFRVIDPARVPEERSSPKRTLITAVGMFFGLMLGMIISLILRPSASKA
ncbi:MAG: Wzz/FepE/Etk N-terminal domain-containing protein [Nevskia sp.]|jgi:uncharacterized protein involved in exopolysaccharide biosynthesis|nr:Wzz/FepE/Etk N-terminal domain-containing protein [Nevskia sp.]